MLVRPCTLEDIDAFERLAFDSPVGMTSLPLDRRNLEVRLRASQSAFAKVEEQGCGEESHFLFAVEDHKGNVLGVSGLMANTGINAPYYNLRRDRTYQVSSSLQKHVAHSALQLCGDNSGKTLLNSFFVDENSRTPELMNLLSRARILFMKQFEDRFQNDVIVEFIGITDENQESPFWNAVGLPFFDMEYDQAEQYFATLSPTFIAELMPPFPIYENLLSESARQVIGKHSMDYDDQLQIALAEGFQYSNFFNFFDAGPCLSGPRRLLKSHQNAGEISLISAQADYQEKYLVSNLKGTDFRCLLVDGLMDAEGALSVSPENLEALGLDPGDRAMGVVL